MPPPPPSSPFTSPRLTYRAIHPTADRQIFTAINADPNGYPASNFSNAKLPGPNDTDKFLKQCSEDSLLGAIIWLPHDPSLTGEPLAREIRRLENEEKEKGVEGTVVSRYGIAIGEIHLSALPQHSMHHRHTEIGLDILPAWQGQGYGTEAITWALEHAFHRLGMHRVSIRAFEYNDGAVRLYEKLGFVQEGREREAYWWEGRWWDGIWMGILEREWRVLREAGGLGGGRMSKGRSPVDAAVAVKGRGEKVHSRKGSHEEEGGLQKRARRELDLDFDLDFEAAGSPFEASRMYVNSLITGQKLVDR
ncbi:hypothetical protein NX059_011907 [Plenodomus lindquistii]|nr:hypothetical protein NX059_011907 [Plenodomus lindquistii]